MYQGLSPVTVACLCFRLNLITNGKFLVWRVVKKMDSPEILYL